MNNICLVVEEIAQLKRSLLDDELYSLCEDLLKYRDRMDDQSKP